jgi:hypothetical protein
MHPYIAYMILSNPVNYNHRPDEPRAPSTGLIRKLWGRLARWR